ncbi:hypothetical protein LEP1GSC079_1502 [Leptospira interrogans str. FPW1039]|uniref:Uncharacterized protein n=2 Tax=Leptospira interrogans TaxID=173 RepID=A0A0F6ICU1_LEPIR|nr:hypothetical protein LEP1GSC067_4111 [Leptospira interrogans serovar Lora str. TE 1992]EMJ35866.1 hypothetical protein LEP1GSC079_1502 [Leptospira interrogans str. FPW1039]EMN06958.1 hypothetical protein LEP1GSC053_0305 [Leptospira interrogans serovar Muenchen str. Brem 129]
MFYILKYIFEGNFSVKKLKVGILANIEFVCKAVICGSSYILEIHLQNLDL